MSLSVESAAVISGNRSSDRFHVLSIFCLMTAINGFSWLMFDPAKDQLNREFSPHFTSTQLTLLSSWQPIMYLLTAPFATAMLVKEDGLRRVMKLGCGLELAGATLKFLACVSPHSSPALVLLHLGQIFSACVSPIAIGAPAQLSARWFPEAERARATGAAVLFNNVGNALTYIVIPALADTASYTYVVMVELYLAIICILVTFLFVPAQPRRIAVAEESAAPVDVKSELSIFFGNRSALILCLVYAWSSGGYVAWTSLFDTVLSGLWSDEFIGSLTFAATMAYIIGGMLSSISVDAFLRHRMRAILITSCVGSSVCCALLSISVPSIFASDRVAILDFGGPWLYFVFVACGFWNGVATPVFYEFAVELTAPRVSEGVSGTTLSYFENMGALVLYQGVGNLVTAKAMNVTFAAGMIATVVAMQFVKSKGLGYAVLHHDDAAPQQQQHIALDVADTPSTGAVAPRRVAARSASTDDLDGAVEVEMASIRRHRQPPAAAAVQASSTAIAMDDDEPDTR